MKMLAGKSRLRSEAQALAGYNEYYSIELWSIILSFLWKWQKKRMNPISCGRWPMNTVTEYDLFSCTSRFLGDLLTEAICCTENRVVCSTDLCHHIFISFYFQVGEAAAFLERLQYDTTADLRDIGVRFDNEENERRVSTVITRMV